VLARDFGASPYVKRRVPLATDPVTVCALVHVQPSAQSNCVPVQAVTLPPSSAPSNEAAPNVTFAGPSPEHG